MHGGSSGTPPSKYLHTLGVLEGCMWSHVRKRVKVAVYSSHGRRRRAPTRPLLALAIDGQLDRRTGSGVSTRGGTWDNHRFGYFVSVLTGIACLELLEVVPVSRAGEW